MSTRGFPGPQDVVVFQPEFVEFGGEERVILALTRELHRQGKPHSVLCYRDGIGLAKYADWPLAVYELETSGRRLARLLALRRAMKALDRPGQPRPILFNIQSAFHAGLAVDAPYHLRIPDTYSLLGPPTSGRASALAVFKQQLSGWLRDAITGRGIRRAKGFITNTQVLRDEMRELYGRSAEVLYLGGFGESAEDISKAAPPPVRLLSVSRIQASKRIDWMLRALAAMTDTPGCPAWELHIAGSGPDRAALETLSVDLGLADKTVFHGFVSDVQLAELYASCHIFLMPARQGFGLPAIEAIYSRLAVVVSDESGVVELLANTPWAFIARGGEEGFAIAVGQALRAVVAPRFFDQPAPSLPTEQGWARQMILRCEW